MPVLITVLNSFAFWFVVVLRQDFLLDWEFTNMGELAD